MRSLLTCFLLLAPILASAQEGSIIYDKAVKYEFEIPPRLESMKDQIPLEQTTSMVLLFNDSESLMKPKVNEEKKPSGNRMDGLVTRLKMGSGSRVDNETFLETYQNYDEGTVVERREFMGRTFLLAGEQPTYAWKLTGEQSEFLGYAVQKATAVKDTSSIEAWFAPEIPVSAGPELYSGLPGLILVVSVDDGRLAFSATEVNLEGLENGMIKAPEGGRVISLEEYEKTVAEKMDEIQDLRKNRGRRGDRRQ